MLNFILFSGTNFLLDQKSLAGQPHPLQYPNLPQVVLTNKFTEHRYPNMSSHGIKTYDSNHKLPYMDSSIQLTSDEVRRIVLPK